MPPVTTSEFEIAAKGTYLTRLNDIECKSAKITRRADEGGGEKDSNFWVWKFRGYNLKDAKRKQTSVEIVTGTNITSKDSALKSLLMSAYPDMSSDERKAFNTDEMVGKAWLIKVGIGEKPNGGEKNIILNIEASDDDPFADKDDDD
jgi:hypothetical protein